MTKLAKSVRFLTVPPLVVGVLLTFLYAFGNVFSSFLEASLSFLFLAAAPVLAYPFAALVPALRRQGREGMRNMAFLFSAVGYAAGLAVSLVLGSIGMRFLFFVYFGSFLLLAFLNKGVHLRASGHACSVMGPVLLSAFYFGPIPAVCGILCWGGVLWASVYAKRHTLKEFLLGSACSAVSFAVCAFLLFLL